jgi:hypothetical protein
MRTYAILQQTLDRKYDHVTRSFYPCEFQTDILGTDGYLPLDGRKGLAGLIADTEKRIEQLKKIKNVTGYRIVKAYRLFENEKVIYKKGVNNEKVKKSF